MSHSIPAAILAGLELAHASWHQHLRTGLHAVMQSDPTYLRNLSVDPYLPTRSRLFAAFSQPLDAIRYVLVGEGPYPRPESATGYCFMDGAVEELWSRNGLSKRVNRATSLRNFMKMLLVADGQLSPLETKGDAVGRIGMMACGERSNLISTLDDLQHNMHSNGFLLLNAALAFRAHVAPAREARAWAPFLETVLSVLADQTALDGRPLPLLILWGKIAERLAAMPVAARFPKAVSEHPYNLTFINNPTMQRLFQPMRLLEKRA